MTQADLLEKCLAYFLRHGVAHLSLRPLAAAVGTSARMLLHYFGSKEALIAAVMNQVQARFQATFKTLLEKDYTRGRADLLPVFWSALAAKNNRPFLRLLFEVQILALQNPKRYQRYLKQSSTGWRQLIEQALPARERNAAAATLYNAVIDGLLLEMLATGDLSRTSRALKLFADRCVPNARRTRRIA